MAPALKGGTTAWFAMGYACLLEESRNTLKALVLRRNTAGSSWVPIAPVSRNPPTRPTVAIWGT
jgi:hypothetical protein